MTKRAKVHWRTMSALADLVLPTSCGGCDRPGVSWCPRCAAVFAAAPPPYRWWPTPAPVGLPPVLTVLAYDGPVRAAVVNWKDNGRRDLAQILAPPLTEGLLATLLSCAAGPRSPPRQIVVPIPSGRANVRRRGDRPLRGLTRQALVPVPTLHRPRVVEALQLRRSVADQAGLDADHRAANLSGAMVVGPRAYPLVSGACCIVVDDVITTGATLVEASRALRSKGAAAVLAVTVAATHRRPLPRRAGQ